MLEVDWPSHSPRSLNCENCFALDTRRKMQEGPLQDHMAALGGEGNQGHGEQDLDLGIKFMARDISDLQMWREHVAALHTT